MDDGVHDARLIHENYHGLGQANGKSSGEDPHGALTEQLTGFARLETENDG